MLSVYPASERGASAVWIDVFDPTDDERRQLHAKYGIDVPSRADLSEIESSSRLVSREGMLRLSLPLVPADGSDGEIAPLGLT